MSRKEDAIEFGLPYNIKECSSKLRAIARELKAQIGPLARNNDGLMEESSDIAVFMEGKNFLGSFGSGKYWMVHIYVDNRENGCQVVLNAVGDSTLSRLAVGGKNAYSFKHALEKRDQIAQMLNS